ncbi:MAG: tRNA-specific adenosine deaminase, partial [Candidatus Cloacimonetes bacterium]|nr:tRNA-specific adenosine deaminase [Candidatus Cloacimonadota bacterium]
MNDQLFMQVALDEARLAALEDEIPVGACLVKNGEIVLRDHNR